MISTSTQSLRCCGFSARKIWRTVIVVTKSAQLTTHRSVEESWLAPPLSHIARDDLLMIST
jgi:hypothetical protein